MSKTSTSKIDALYRCVEQYSASHKLIEANQTVIIGLSGGPDSVFLLYAFVWLRQVMGLRIVAAHLDHGWRSNSTNDVIFCQKLCAQLDLTYVHAHARDIHLGHAVEFGTEEHGRLLRRAFFERVASDYGATTIALGHHANDQEETFFIRLLRGAGLTGLTGIKPCDKLGTQSIIHPLLCCTKAEILAALDEQTIAYLTDPTNASNEFLRNRIRNILMPALHACDARASSSLKRTMDNLRETDDFLQSHVQAVFNQITSLQESGTVMLDYEKLLAYHPYLQKQLLITWLISAGVSFVPSQALFQEILRFLKNTKSTSHVFYHSWSIVKTQHSAFINKFL